MNVASVEYVQHLKCVVYLDTCVYMYIYIFRAYFCDLVGGGGD